MKILQLTKKVPYPLKDGETLAIHYMAKGFVENGVELTLLAMNTKKHHVQWTTKPELLAHYEAIHTIDVDGSVSYLSAIKNLFGTESYNISRFISKAYEKALIKLLQENDFEVIHLEGLFLTPYIETIRQYSNALIAMRSHNLEFEIWKNLSQEVRNPLKAWYYRLCYKRLYRSEMSSFEKYDILLPISSMDSNKYLDLGYKKNYLTSPVGLDLDNYLPSFKEGNQADVKIGYIGSLDWQPNIEGIDWFNKKVWPRIVRKHSQISFHLAGRSGNEELLPKDRTRYLYYGEVVVLTFLMCHSIAYKRCGERKYG